MKQIDFNIKPLYDCYVLTSRIGKNIKIKLNACVCFQLRGHFFINSYEAVISLSSEIPNYSEDPSGRYLQQLAVLTLDSATLLYLMFQELLPFHPQRVKLPQNHIILRGFRELVLQFSP